MKLRLHQFLSRTGAFTSKKDVVSSVRNGEVSIAGEVVVNPEFIFDATKCRVFWKGRLLQRVKGSVYVIINKPEGYLSSRLSSNDRKLGKRSVFELVEKDKSIGEATMKALFCVGRLDEDTSGLLLMTNDGKLGSRLTDPKYGIKKTYLAELQKPISGKAVVELEKGVVIGLEENGRIADYKTKGCRIEVTAADMKKLKVTVTEGRKREVRRIFEAVGNKVLRLQRVALGSLKLEDLNLKKGKYLIADRKLIENATLL
ncbi:rRNA pseudouridine synthase [Candidatus Woesearchaeota archaeon]|nr:rRNA pseudouridine synthase [Candidatus Woesearchaeota archaeon]